MRRLVALAALFSLVAGSCKHGGPSPDVQRPAVAFGATADPKTYSPAVSSSSSSGAGPRIVTLTDGATVTPTVTSGTNTVGLLVMAGNRTIANPSGTASDGSSLELRVITGVARTPTWGSQYAASSQAALPTSFPAGESHVGFRRQASSNTWYCVAVVTDVAGPTVAFTSSGQSQSVATLTARLQLSAATRWTVSVPVTCGGTSDPGNYTCPSSPATIAAGDTYVDLSVPITTVAGTITLTMGTPSYATAGATTVHTMTSMDSTVQAYSDAITAAGGTIDSTLLANLSTNVAAFKTDHAAQWAKVMYIWPVLGDQWAAAKVPMYANGGALASNYLTSVGSGTVYGDGDYAQSTGITAKTNEGLSTLVNALSVLGLNDHGLHFFYRSDPAVGTCDNGVGDTGFTLRASPATAGTVYFDSRNGRVTYTTATINGLYSIVRTSSTSMKGYRNGTLINTDTTAATGSLPNRNIYALGHNNAGTLNPCDAGKISATFMLTTGVDGTDMGILSTWIHDIQILASRDVP